MVHFCVIFLASLAGVGSDGDGDSFAIPRARSGGAFAVDALESAHDCRVVVLLGVFINVVKLMALSRGLVQLL